MCHGISLTFSLYRCVPFVFLFLGLDLTYSIIRHMFSKAFGVYSQKWWAWESTSQVGCWGCVTDWLQRHPLIPPPCCCSAHASLRLRPANDWAQQGSHALQTRRDAPQPGNSSSRTHPWTRWNSLRTALQSKTSLPSFPLPSQGWDVHFNLMALPASSSGLPVFPHRYFAQQISYICFHLGVCFSENPD